MWRPENAKFMKLFVRLFKSFETAQSSRIIKQFVPEKTSSINAKATSSIDSNH